MTISDNNSERKNLTISSLAIILFYLGGGKISGSDIRLQVVNVTFSNPEVLIYFVWGMLVWFCYRYWVVGQGSWKKGFYDELAGDDCKWVYYRYLVKKFGLSSDHSNSYYPNKHWLRISSEHEYPPVSG